MEISKQEKNFQIYITLTEVLIDSLELKPLEFVITLEYLGQITI